jgi:hypothetical protein
MNVTSLLPVLQGDNVSKNSAFLQGLCMGEREGDEICSTPSLYPHFCCFEKEQKLLILTKFFCNSFAY